VAYLLRPTVCLLFSQLSGVPIAKAQHSADNAVLSADDAFGFALGTESIGIYSPGCVRGFNPQGAGDVRIDGLYFDNRAPLSGRVIEQSVIRVGISEIGYVFPAPTGIVDYGFRRVSTDKPIVTVIANGGPFESRGLTLDASLPLSSQMLALPIGVGYQIAAGFPGYTTDVASIGLAPQWKPSDRVEFRAFFDWEKSTHNKAQPYIFTAGNYLPPKISRGYLGQDWAEGTTVASNYGALVHAKLNQQISLSAGLFRSTTSAPASYADLYVNTQPTGLADHQVVAFPKQRIASTSGEIRLTTHFARGKWSHDIVSIIRGRDAASRYGGGDAIDAGSAFIGAGAQIDKPAFLLAETTRDHTQSWSGGLAYHGHWLGHAELSGGVQRVSYHKAVSVPGFPELLSSDVPWRSYGNLAVEITKPLTAYAGFTQGLEDSGVVPNTAVNAGTNLPAAQTGQVDGGFRYALGSGIKFSVGVFELQKPYFNIDQNNVDRKLGNQKARGVELSVAGEVFKGFNIVAGAVIGHVQITGSNLANTGIGSSAVGQPHVRADVNGNYDFQRLSGLSTDLSVTYFGSAPVNTDNALSEHATTTLNIGGRYRLLLHGTPATLRVQIQNALNVREWNISLSPGFYQVPPPRSILAYLTVDLS